MPVHVDRGKSEITADGAVPTQIDSNNSPAAIVPLLIFTGQVEQLKINNLPIANQPLRSLASHQQLVAIAGGGDQLAQKLFPGESIISIHVDPLNPLPGPAIAWQALDALIIDGPWPGGLDVQKIPALLAGGTEIAVRSIDRPSAPGPWQSIDGGWVLRPAIAGPIGCDGTDAAYEPTIAWHPDLPSALRWQIVFASVLFSVAGLSCLLLPHAKQLPAMIGVTLFAIVLIDVWKNRLPSIDLAQGNVIVSRRSFRQIDHWQFATSRQSATADRDCVGACWPIFADSSQPGRAHITLNWAGDAGKFRYQLQPQAKLAFMSREVYPAADYPPDAELSGSPNPMSSLARSLYLQKQDQMATESAKSWKADDPSPAWGSVHISAQ